MPGASYPVDTLYGEPLSSYSAAAAGPAQMLRLSDPDPAGDENSQEDVQELKPKGLVSGASATSQVTAVLGLVLIPWVVFALVMLPFALSYRHYGNSCWLLSLLALLLSSLFVVSSRQRGGRARYCFFLGVLCFVATACGLLLGLYDYYKYTQSYHIYNEGRWYGNVMPSDHPGAKKDAGMISFSSDTYVDPVKGVGFRSGSLYCVAPIVGDNTDDFVGYWAVGTDCCRSRGLFECGDVWDPNAHSGMVLFEESPVLPADSDLYRMAVDQAAATYELSVPESPTFVRWVVDLEAQRDQYQADAVRFLLTSIALFLLCMMVIGLGLHLSSAKLTMA